MPRAAEPVAIIVLMTKQCLGVWQGCEQQNSALVVVHLIVGAHHHDAVAFSVAHRMELRAQADFSAPDTPGTPPLFIGLLLSGAQSGGT